MVVSVEEADGIDRRLAGEVADDSQAELVKIVVAVARFERAGETCDLGLFVHGGSPEGLLPIGGWVRGPEGLSGRKPFLSSWQGLGRGVLLRRGAGFVTRFAVAAEYLQQFEVHEVGRPRVQRVLDTGGAPGRLERRNRGFDRDGGRVPRRIGVSSEA